VKIAQLTANEEADLRGG